MPRTRTGPSPLQSTSSEANRTPDNLEMLTSARYNGNAIQETGNVEPQHPGVAHSRRTSSRQSNFVQPQGRSYSSADRHDDGASAASSRQRNRREKDKKHMLSKALAKANTAVTLDNVQNFEGATEAYMDACTLLTQVMNKSSAEEDVRKLEAIVSLLANSAAQFSTIS
jgi:hypothetical protein